MTCRLRLMAADRAGSSAVEMALVMPLFFVLMFGTFELGNFFLQEHVVQKAVRDAARYAARLPISSYPGGDCTPTAAATQQIQRVARTGTPDGTVQRLQGWTNDSMTTITIVDCDDSDTAYGGVFAESPKGRFTIAVSASVPYPSLFGTLGLPHPSLELNARSHTAVFGA